MDDIKLSAKNKETTGNPGKTVKICSQDMKFGIGKMCHADNKNRKNSGKNRITKPGKH